VGAPDFPRRPLADKSLYWALVCVNAYKGANPKDTTLRDYASAGVLRVKIGSTA